MITCNESPGTFLNICKALRNISYLVRQTRLSLGRRIFNLANMGRSEPRLLPLPKATGAFTEAFTDASFEQ